MKKINLHPLDTKTPFSRGYLLMVGCLFVLSCQESKPSVNKIKSHKVYEGNQLIDKIAQSAKLSKADV
jgi:hypothetical protein